MDLSTVESSNIAAIGFDGKTIAVQFKNGNLYHYSGGEGDDMAALFEDFRGSESKGKFFHGHIRGRMDAEWVSGPSGDGD